MKNVLACLLAFGIAAPCAQAQTAADGQTGDFDLHKNVAYGTDPRQILDVYQPHGETTHPLVVMIHGGGWIAGGKANVGRVALYCANNGFVVANIDYRISAPGVNLYPAAIDDVSSAITWLKAHAKTYLIDPKKVAVFGVSAGGYLAIEAANKGEASVLVDFYGPVNLADPNFLSDVFARRQNSEIMETYLGGSVTDKAALYAKASPINDVSAADPPAIIFHGQFDQVVPVEQAQSFSDKLKKAGVACQLVVLPAGHGFLTNPHFDAAPYLKQAVDFLHTHLDGR